ncbi:MAG: class I SAM-dependent methyltransferase [Nitrospirae bacterium]|nr:class I SAM-dependent methyltransferase [Nitrospirota bacterium]
MNVGHLSHERCPVCETELNAGPPAPMVLTTPRGKQEWVKCPACRSFFADEGYDPEQEVDHTRTRPWGTVESGVALNDEKGPLFETVLRVLRRCAPPGATLLDIGCSYGGFLLQAQNEGYDVRGMDIVPEAVRYVRSRGIPCDRAGSVRDLDVPENSLEVISVLDCNYYWPRQREELRAIRSRLCPGGLLVMRTVDTSWAVQIGLWLGKWLPETGRRLSEKAVYDHRVSIPVRSLLRLVRQEGFDILYASPQDAMPFRRNSLKVRTAYAIGGLAWRTAGYNLAPGFLFLAGKKAL